MSLSPKSLPQRNGRIIWCVVVSCLVLITGGGLFVFDATLDHVTLENYARIKEGMTKKEVEAILSGLADVRMSVTVDFELREWFGEQFTVQVVFFDDESVFTKAYCDKATTEKRRKDGDIPKPMILKKVLRRLFPSEPKRL